MPDEPKVVNIDRTFPDPPPAPEKPISVREAVAQVQKEMQEGTLKIGEDDAVSVGEAEAVDVGEQAGDGGGVDEGGEEPERKDARAKEQPPKEEGEGEGEEEGVEGERFTVKLPPRREGEEPLEIDLEGLPEDAQEGFKRLMNMGLRRDQLDAAMDQVRAVQGEVQDVMIAMETDPINFIYERTTPELRAQLARHILADPAIYEEVIPEIARWDNSPDVREAAQAKLERDRILAQRDAEGILARKARSRQNAAEIHNHVTRMVPEDAPEHIQELFVDQAMRVIQQYAVQHKKDMMDLAEIQPILAQTNVIRLLEAHGGVRQVTNHPPEPSSAAPANVTAAVSKSLQEAAETSERFRKTSAKKKSATAVAPPGAGPAPAMPPQPPEEAQRSVKEAIKWYRKNVMR